MLDWLSDHAGILVAVSVLSLVMGVLLAPVLVMRIPQDYFVHHHRHRAARQSRHPLLNGLLIAGKNLLGALLVAAGILMLFLPGQGLLTLLAGLMIMNYPGKYRLECWLVTRPGVLRAINWLRGKYRKPPLLAPRAQLAVGED